MSNPTEAELLAMIDTVPRRSYVQRWTPAERAIKDAVEAVEIVGCDPLLTDVVVLLQQAFNKLADYTDREGA